MDLESLMSMFGMAPAASGSPPGMPDPMMGTGNLPGTAVPMPQYPSLGQSLDGPMGGSPAGMPVQAPSMPMPSGLPGAPTTAGPAGMPTAMASGTSVPADVGNQALAGAQPRLQDALKEANTAFQGVQSSAAPQAQTVKTPAPPAAPRPVQAGGLINMLSSLGMRPQDLPSLLASIQRGGFRA